MTKKTTWVDFKEIRTRVSLEDVLFTYYELSGFKRSGDKLTGPCPVHAGDNPRAFHADLPRNLWHCFTGCGGGGNQLDLVAKKEDISIREAALKLQSVFLHRDEHETEQSTATRKGSRATRDQGKAQGTTSTDTRESPTDEDPTSSSVGGQSIARLPVPENPVLDLRLQLLPDHPHLLEDRRLRQQTCEEFGVGYCRRGILRGCIAIPVHNATGQLVAYAGRRLKPQLIRERGKYVFPKGFRKELELYGFHTAKDCLEEGLILVEGFFSVLKLYEAGLRGVVASMGCELSDQQADLLSQASEVIILFDGNDAGRAGAERARAKLEGRTIVRIAELPDGFEPEDLAPRALRWLVNGMRALDLSRLSLAFTEQDSLTTDRE